MQSPKNSPVEQQSGALRDADSASQASIDELAAALAKLSPDERAAILAQIRQPRG